MKRNSFAWLVTGLIIGFTSCFFLMRSPTVSQAAKSPEIEPIVQIAPVPGPSMEMFNSLRTSSPQKEPDIQSELPEPERDERIPTEPPPVRRAKPNMRKDISFSPAEVENLERHWRVLREQAAAQEEVRGWRILRLEPDSLLAKSGLQEGDLITRESLAVYSQGDSEEDLAHRIANILEHISK